MPDPMSIAGALSELECRVLGEVARESGARHALEIGHYLGRSTAVLLSHLPPECSLVTIDHHQGDEWCPDTDPNVFRANVAPFVGERKFLFVDGDMMNTPPQSSDFVFYDSDHTAEAVGAWWSHQSPWLDGECTLVFDDADWDGQNILTALAVAAGFRSVKDREFYRGPEDKRDPETYTLEVMRRDA